ncbi:ATP-binding protein [Microbacterium sp. Leaf159]|uniref:ATP-binding protein n=1 Tax=Microbacterium sp. Leaf159 TaxID=1736279 RepID=UPI0006F51142|nr:ATP-binding protein [Microbacterium sp. Leaf159]KQR39361.1 hypothetical protein ASF80_08075 [Microbacterium sp. Leaf159]
MEENSLRDIGTKEGWREYVDANYVRPAQIDRDELRRLSQEEREHYNDERARYSQAGAFVRTPQFTEVQRAVLERVMLNKHKQVGQLGVIVSGQPAQGKTTTLLEIGKEHERRRRKTGHPAAKEHRIPVAYVAVPAQCSAKALLQEFARFYGLPVKPRMTYGGILEMVANAMRHAGTELVLVDDVHHLDLQASRKNVEASDMLKQLSERCGGTFVFAGIEVEATGLLSGTREGQMRKRFLLQTAGPYGIDTRAQQTEWGNLLLSIEDSLCLIDQTPGAILGAARDLHSLTGGEIGLLKNMLQLTALRSTLDGTEKIDNAEFSREVKLRQRSKADGGSV